MEVQERRRVAAILAGLRLLQASTAQSSRSSSAHAEAIDDIATSGGDFEALNATEIDELCEAINTGEVELITQVPA
jgi:hypothetical protein